MQKSGIAMIMAIMVIVIIGTIMALSIAMTSLTTKKTTDLYLYEQSILYARSATEYALLKVAQDGPCTHTNDLVFQVDSIYNVDITLAYIYDDATNPCSATDTYATVTTPEQNGSILVDVAVSVTDPTISTEPIRYFRRTIQKL